MKFLNIIFFLASLVLIVPCLVFFLECMAAFLPRKDRAKIAKSPRPTTTVLVPAHNEELYIEQVLKSISKQLTDRDKLIVIADNCQDKTAELARNAGAVVIERKNTTNRGKGYALDYGMQFIRNEPPEVLVILDGDCIIEPNTIENIICLAAASGRPVQATYLMEQPDNTSLKDKISMFALKIKNLVRLQGLNRLGLHCLLTGSGMAFPWSVINQVSLAGCKTTDDTQLTVDLALNGYGPMFCEDALVMGRLMKDRDSQSQRSRWEHGHLEMILVEVPRLLKAFTLERRLAILALALDIAVPPLSLLMIILITMLVNSYLAVTFAISIMPAIVLTIGFILLTTGLISAWLKFGRSDLPWQNLIAIPLYMLNKIPIYLNFLTNPQNRWLNTERD